MAPDGRNETDINQRRSAMNKLKYSPVPAPRISRKLQTHKTNSCTYLGMVLVRAAYNILEVGTPEDGHVLMLRCSQYLCLQDESNSEGAN